MTTKEQKTAADKVQKLQADLVKVRAELDNNRAKMVNDPTSDAIAQAITTGQIKLEAINKALNNALDEQRRVEIEAQREATRDQVKRINDLEGKAERDKRGVYNAIDALKKDLDELQKGAVEHNRLTNKYQQRRGYIAKSDYRLLWRLQTDLEKLQKQKRYIDNLGKPPAPDPERKFTELQKAVSAERYHAPDEGTEVKLLENDYGTGDPVYRVKQR